MKNTWWLILCLVVVVALGAVGCARGGSVTVAPQQQTGIWVTGQGEVMAVPDVAELRLGVEVQADTVAEAQAQASGCGVPPFLVPVTMRDFPPFPKLG